MCRIGWTRIVERVGKGADTTTIQEYIMTSRTAAVTLIAIGTLALSTGVAAARPMPDPLPRQAVTVARTLEDLTSAYFQAPSADKRGLHNDITLLVNLGSSALR